LNEGREFQPVRPTPFFPDFLNPAASKQASATATTRFSFKIRSELLLLPIPPPSSAPLLSFLPPHRSQSPSLLLIYHESPVSPLTPISRAPQLSEECPLHDFSPVGNSAMILDPCSPDSNLEAIYVGSRLRGSEALGLQILRFSMNNVMAFGHPALQRGRDDGTIAYCTPYFATEFKAGKKTR